MEAGSVSNPTWRKSSFSGPQGDCVQLAALDNDEIGLRDSKLADASPVLHLTRDQFKGLVAGVKAGEFQDMV
jgi:hypothetical protein